MAAAVNREIYKIGAKQGEDYAITISGKGEEGLLVATPDQTKMESNRRGQIVVQ